MLLISMTLIRVVTVELALKLILILPNKSLQVDLIPDCYFENSISAAEIVSKVPQQR